MNRWLWIGSMTGLLMLSTGCLHHNTRSGCSSCPTGAVSSDCGCGDSCGSGSCGTSSCGTGGCGTASCGSGDCGSSSSCGGRLGGLLGKGRGRLAGCNAGCGPCGTGKLGWQQGGLDYSSHLNPGFMGHGAGKAVAGQPFTAGAPTAQVAYPYYTHRGPRDFLQANPPSIGP